LWVWTASPPSNFGPWFDINSLRKVPRQEPVCLYLRQLESKRNSEMIKKGEINDFLIEPKRNGVMDFVVLHYQQPVSVFLGLRKDLPILRIGDPKSLCWQK